MGHLMNRKLSAGWRALQAAAAERREAMQLMRKGLSFLANSKLAVAFASWRGDNAATALLSASAQRQRDAKAKAMGHLLNRHLSRGWTAWHARWEAVARKRASARRGLSHLMNRKLSAGYRSWEAMVAERREVKAVLDELLGEEGASLRVRSAAHYCEGEERLSFAHLSKRARDQPGGAEIIVGFCELGGEPQLNPARKYQLRCWAGTEIIVLEHEQRLSRRLSGKEGETMLSPSGLLIRKL